MTTHIMVIDDEPLICRLLEYQLGGSGYTVTTYQHAYEAVVQLAYAQPDLILLDVMMPDISGWDLCRQIRASSNVPIIMLTAKDGDDDVIRGLTSGADDYVGKPFNQGQLVARIEAVLRRAQASTGRTRPPAPAAAGPIPATVIDPSADEALSARLAARPTPPPPVRPQSEAAPLPRLGASFATARKQRGLSLHDAAHAAGVRWEFLQAIEQEEFSYVPQVELRTALQAYSRLLGVDLKPYAARSKRSWHRRNRLPMTATIVAMIVLSIVFIVLAL